MKSFLALLGLALALSGCGSTTGDRAASGAGIGAGAGAVLGAVTGLSIVQGVLIGAAAGGITGAVTDRDTIDLGDPLWADNNYADNSAVSGKVTAVQEGLARLGYDPGPADGKYGPMTKRAIERYQADHGLLTDGLVTDQLTSHVRGQVAQKS